MEEKTDKELYLDFLNGNDKAFEEIMIRYKDKLINFIIRYVKNFEVAEDLSQDTFVYVLINRKEYDFKYSLKTYLFLIAKCRAINYINRQKRIVKFDESYIKNQEENIRVEDKLIKEEDKREVMQAFEKLKPEYQLALLLKDIENFKYKDICKILDKNLSQVKILIHRARKSLEKKLKEGRKC